MDAGNAAAVAVGSIEDGRIHVRRRGAECEEVGRDPVDGRAASLDELDRSAGPVCPMTKQATHHPDGAPLALVIPEPEGRCQVGNDIVIVTRVQRDLRGSARLDHRAHHIEGRVPIERSDLDGNHGLELGEPSPETVAQLAATCRRLQIEADER